MARDPVDADEDAARQATDVLKTVEAAQTAQPFSMADAADAVALPDAADEPLSDSPQAYLHQIGMHRLFTPAEELHHARLAAVA